MLLINKCEKCALFKAHKIVLKLFKKLKISNKLFYRIIYNVMPTSQRPYSDLAAIPNNLAAKPTISVLTLQKLNP